MRRSTGLRPGGFTLIELLIVIAILLVLMGLAVTGMYFVGNTSREKSARVTLHSAKSLFGELDQTGGLKRQPAFMWLSGASLPSTTPNFNIWKIADPANPNNPANFVNAPLDVTRSAGPARLTSDSVRNTVMVMSQILSIPANRTMQGKIPANELVMVPRDPNWNTASATFDPTRYPILLDPWGNPIIFVPCGRDTAGIPTGGLRVMLKGNPTPQTIYSPDYRPFWASAGPDGVFGYADKNGNNAFDAATDVPGGDDNIYSFEE